MPIRCLHHKLLIWNDLSGGSTNGCPNALIPWRKSHEKKTFEALRKVAWPEMGAGQEPERPRSYRVRLSGFTACAGGDRRHGSGRQEY